MNVFPFSFEQCKTLIGLTQYSYSGWQILNIGIQKCPQIIKAAAEFAKSQTTEDIIWQTRSHAVQTLLLCARHDIMNRENLLDSVGNILEQDTSENVKINCGKYLREELRHYEDILPAVTFAQQIVDIMLHFSQQPIARGTNWQPISDIVSFLEERAAKQPDCPYLSRGTCLEHLKRLSESDDKQIREKASKAIASIQKPEKDAAIRKGLASQIEELQARAQQLPPAP